MTAVPPAPAAVPPPHGSVKKINLALQGGGAHGAFTWGVVDYLLEDGRIAIAGLSGTSAGAINAVICVDGLARGGPPEARRRLADFWRAVSIDGKLPVMQRRIVERMLNFTPLERSPVQAWLNVMSRYFSPYDLNPLNINPLKEVIERFVDFEAVRSATGVQLYVAATNVVTGRLRIFPRDKITADVVMASAALPLVFQAVTIEGTPYWDGGYMGNPAIFPFFRDSTTEDVLIVQINPLERQDVPTSVHDIMNRVNEITFNSSLLAEYRAIEFVAREIDLGRLPHGLGAGEYRRINAHRVVLGEGHNAYSADSKLSTDYDFFRMLHASGRHAARHFLDKHFDDIGVRSTFDLRAEAQAEWA
ncbi:MAG: patatin-like phospholipase family protein [Alphaproteobacteria bacterium]|nr:patatin-like phospholipase family protein [Alphaproteobacteria bacterium]